MIRPPPMSTPPTTLLPDPTHVRPDRRLVGRAVVQARPAGCEGGVAVLEEQDAGIVLGAGGGEHQPLDRRRRVGDENREAVAQDAHAAVAVQSRRGEGAARHRTAEDRSEEHTSELQSLMRTSYAVFCLKKKKTNDIKTTNTIHFYSERSYYHYEC